MDGGKRMRWLVTGASGTLGSYLVQELALRERSVIGWSGTAPAEHCGVSILPVDLANHDAVTAAFQAAKPDIVVHAGAMARIDDCFRSPERARRINVEGTQHLAELTAKYRARLIYLSTDLVFDGTQSPYREECPPQPLSVYGRTKADAEAAVLAGQNGVVVRVSLLLGPSRTRRAGMFDSLIDALRTGRSMTLFADEWRTPLGLSDAARALHALGHSAFTGTIHLGGPERLSRLEMGQRLARHLNLSDADLVAGQRDSIPGSEPRPRDVSLDSALWRSSFPHFPMPDFESALTNMLKL
jgi:dTDP-4-dehydrorhamnose reductase